METSQIIKLLNTVEKVISKNKNHLQIVKPALKFQLALLALGTKQVRSLLSKQVRVKDGLTAAEAEKARDPAGKIQAIKMVRERKSKEGKPFGLKEAKDLVEDWMYTHLGFTSHPIPQSETASRVDSNGQPW
jgi:ribosomal protein L7/L12